MTTDYGKSTEHGKPATKYKESYNAKIDLSTEYNGKRTEYKGVNSEFNGLHTWFKSEKYHVPWIKSRV